MIKKYILGLTQNNLIMFLFLIAIGSYICSKTQFNFGWDFVNYHYYNAFAFLNNRLNYDIVPGSVNTFLNPLIELPFYFILQYFNDAPQIAFALQGVWFGLLLFAFYKVTTLFFPANTIKGVMLSFATLAVAATGQATWFQAGTSTNEIQIAFLVYSALYILFKMIKDGKTEATYKFFVAGLILGAALGLKSTCVYICLATGLSLIICYKYLSQPVKYISLFALGGLAGYLALNGWWMYKMWSLYGNPFFPFFNGIFHSPYFDDFNFTDKRFIPPLHIVPIFPYIWNGGKYGSAEIAFWDLRGIVFYSVALLFVVYMLSKPKRIKEFYLTRKLWCFYTVFMILGYILWMAGFSIYRYLVVIEMGAAVFFIKIISLYCPKSLIKQVLYLSFVIVINAILILNAQDGKSWPQKRNDNKLIWVENIKLPENTLLKLYNFPTAGVIPVLSKTNNFRALGYQHLNATYMQGSDFVERGEFRKMRDKIEQEHKGPVVVIYRMLSYFSPNYKKLYDILMPVVENMYCRKLENTLDSALFICVSPELKQQILLEEDKYGK